MDFFARQRSHRQRSFWLYLLFFLVVALHFWVGIFIIELVFKFSSHRHHGVRFIEMLIVGIGVLGLFGFGFVTEAKNLSAGGRGLARRLGGKRLFIDNQLAWYQGNGEVIHDDNNRPLYKLTDHSIIVHDAKDLPLNYRRFYEFATQMSIASGTPLPALFVIPSEQGINGFVAGHHANDTVMVVTQGAVDKLSDEGLYGLIAHEYSHIIHGDASFNLKMAVVLAGLEMVHAWFSGDYQAQQHVAHGADPNWFAIANPDSHSMSSLQTESRVTPEMVGYNKQQWVEHWRQQNQAHARLREQDRSFELSSGRDTGKTGVMGWGVYLLSASSLFCAKLIKTGFSRQRKFLADATGLQLTRSKAVVQTLREIETDRIGSRLTGAGMGQFSYLFFAPAQADFSSQFQEHPSTAERMQAIDKGEYRAFAEQVAHQLHLNEQMIADIHEQKRQGTWQQLVDKNQPERPDVDFVKQPDKVVDGRLDVGDFRAEVAEIRGWDILLVPLLAKTLSPSVKVPNLPQNLNQALTAQHLVGWESPLVIEESLFHPLKSLAVIEAVMLCHSQIVIDRLAKFDLAQIWLGVPTTTTADNSYLAHTIDKQLLLETSKLDRRLDELLLNKALIQLQKFITPTANVPQLDDKQRQTLTVYLNGLAKLVSLSPQIIAEQCQSFDVSRLATDKLPTTKDEQKLSPHQLPKPPNHTLWQAVQLYRIIIGLQKMLGVEMAELSVKSLQKLSPLYRLANDDFWQQFINNHQLSAKHQAILLLFSVVLLEQLTLDPNQDIDHLDPQNVQAWLMPSAQCLSRQIRLYEFGISAEECIKLLLWLVKVQKQVLIFQPLSLMGLMVQFLGVAQTVRQSVLSSVHTLMLQDMTVSQHEHDSLLGLAEIWLGKRMMVD
ncbi:MULTISPECIES: M48 family metalloprotease [unclassified Moraxella]|uniref:M48 family metalloprotease n=1 Tax=unclassified Moraxella TaxID=2685852 RepID=UPI003AF6FBD2